jgi:hypothetical protein
MSSENDTRNESSNDDLALKTLLAVATEVSPSISENLLKRLFLIQSRHQFDSDRSASVQEMQRIIEAEVAAISEGK